MSMYEKAFQLEIITPQEIVFRGDASSVSAPGAEGGFQVLFDHAPFLSVLEIGKITAKDTSGNDLVYAISGGFFEVVNNHAVVLVDSAERQDKIDVDRALAAKARALKLLQTKDGRIDVARAQASLARALNRIRVARPQ
jgi:F-type H+-transporting ATPase subunit epsilon